MKRTIRPITLALIFALTVSGCSPQLGEGWLGNADQATHDGYGVWVRVTLRFSLPNEKQYEGELLAVSNDSLYLIDVSRRSFEVVARQDIDEVVGNTYDRGGYGVFAGEAILGILLSPFTSGFYFFIVAPLYIISAIGASIVASRISRISYDGDGEDWHELSIYARFPTGLPPTYYRANPKTKSMVPN